MIVRARPASYRCITRIVEPEKGTRGWEVRVIRRGIAINEYFADRRFGGKAGALSEAMHFRDGIVSELKPIPRSELARRKIARNTSGIPGVRRGIQKVRRGENVYKYIIWTASGSPSPRQRKTRHFYVTEKVSEDDAREAAIAQRLRWEKEMERRERGHVLRR